MKPSQKSKRSNLMHRRIRLCFGYRSRQKMISGGSLSLSLAVANAGKFSRAFVWVGDGENCGYICAEN